MITDTMSSIHRGPAGLCGTAGLLVLAAVGSVAAGLVSPGAAGARAWFHGLTF